MLFKTSEKCVKIALKTLEKVANFVLKEGEKRGKKRYYWTYGMEGIVRQKTFNSERRQTGW